VLRRVVDDVRREGPPHAIGRERVRARVVALLQRQVEARRGDSPSDAWLRRIGRSAPVARFLDAAWSAVTAEALVFSLLTDSEALARVAEGILTEAEQAALVWSKSPRSVRSAKWSSADAMLID
jgi:hypothetical protein